MVLSFVDLRTWPSENWLRTVVANHPFKPLSWVPGVTLENQIALMSHELTQALEDEHCSLLACKDDGKIFGFAELKPMDWDSGHFGINVFRLRNFGVWGNLRQIREANRFLIRETVKFARERGANTIHTLLPLEMISSVHALEEAGFRTMDAHITLVFEHSKQSILDYKDSCTIRDYKASDENKLIGIARDAFTKTPDRFHADPNLPADRKNEVYAEWIRNSCSGQLADYVVVAELNGEPVGYATAKFHGDHGGLSNTKTGTLVVGAVAPSAQRKGIIISLEIACLKWLNAKNTDVSCVGTQVNNYAVQRTFVRLGFRPAMAGVHMHIWTGTINSARRHASSCI